MKTQIYSILYFFTIKKGFINFTNAQVGFVKQTKSLSTKTLSSTVAFIPGNIIF